MPRNSSGTQVAANGPYIAGQVADPNLVNARFADEEAEITDSLSRSGKGGMLAPVRGTDGTVAAPAYSYTSEVGTGFYRAGAGDVRLSIGGVDAARWSASGVAFPVGAVSSDAQLTLGGALDAGSTGADVTIYSKNVRTAGFLLALQNQQGSNRLLVDYNGLLRLQVPAAAIQPASLYTAPTLAGTWAAIDGLAYWKDAGGNVRVKGGVTASLGATGTVFTFPTGFQPTGTRRFPVWNATAIASILALVDTTGAVTLQPAPASGATIGLDTICFPAEK